jgi:Protein of unknown function (DUF3027)
MNKDLKIKYLGNYMEPTASEIVSALVDAGVEYWSKNESPGLPLGEFGVRIFVDKDRLGEARVIADRIQTESVRRQVREDTELESPGSSYERWMARRNRKQESPQYMEEWYEQQCGMCLFWVPLSGALGEDWGACTNPDSPFDGQVRFEHDGCDRFTSAEGWAQSSDGVGSES